MSASELLRVAASKMDLFDATKVAIGRALSEEQQVAVSAKLARDQNAFITWLGTDAGIVAARQMAEAFTTEPLAKPESK